MQNNNIKKIRNSKNITLERLAEISGVSIGYLCHLEKGTRDNPSMHIMEKIAMGLQKTVIEVFFEK